MTIMRAAAMSKVVVCLFVSLFLALVGYDVTVHVQFSLVFQSI